MFDLNKDRSEKRAAEIPARGTARLFHETRHSCFALEYCLSQSRLFSNDCQNLIKTHTGILVRRWRQLKQLLEPRKSYHRKKTTQLSEIVRWACGRSHPLLRSAGRSISNTVGWLVRAPAILAKAIFPGSHARDRPSRDIVMTNTIRWESL